MTVLKIDQSIARKKYNKDYLNKLVKKYNDLLGFEGATSISLEFIDRGSIDWGIDLQPKRLSLTPNDVSAIKTLYSVWDYDFECEPQMYTNRGDWWPGMPSKQEGVSGFKRHAAQEGLEQEGTAFVDSNEMVYLKVSFSSPKAFHYFKSLVNVTEPKEMKAPNSPSDIVKTLQDTILAGGLPGKDDKENNLYDTNNESALMKEIKILTPDKNDPFRSEVKGVFYADGGENPSFEIYFKGNIKAKLDELNLPKSGGSILDRNSHFYVGASGEMKTTWFNAEKKISNTGNPVDFAIYIGVPKTSTFYDQRLFEVRGFLNVLTMKARVDEFRRTGKMSDNPDISSFAKIYRFYGFIWQKKTGLAAHGGWNEKEAFGSILRTPYQWFGVKDDKELKKFLAKNTLTIGRVFGLNDLNEEKEAVDIEFNNIMALYKNSICGNDFVSVAA
jgi:hypothetical protein